MSKKLTTSEFIQRAKQIHGDKYDYSLVTYINIDTNITVTCKEHGEFNIRPANHLSHKRGCQKCSASKLSSSYTKTAQNFIKKAKQVHGDRYNYNKVQYSHCETNIIIVCNEHGSFEQRPSNHLIGRGCPKCGFNKISEHIKKEPNSWNYSKWKLKAEKSKNFDSFKVYIIKCWNDEEEFYKIGKTFTTVEKRFKKSNMPYNYEIVKLTIGEAIAVSKIEKEMQNNNKGNKYIPKIKFNGMYECFKSIK